MNDRVTLRLDLSNNTKFNDIGIEVCFDGYTYYDNQVSPGKHFVCFDFADMSGKHVLEVTLKNKTFDHTQVDDNGNIVEDAVISIDNVFIDNIKIDQLLYNVAKYSHNHNGTTKWDDHKFHGHLGCNGTLKFEFTTPFYLWLLGNM